MHGRLTRTLKTVVAGSFLTACAASTLPAFAQVGIGITIGRVPPPPVRYEAPPPPPGPEFLWTDGFWNWSGNRYLWIPGHYERRPYPDAYWTHPHYDRYADGWHLHEGHWDHEDHGNHYGWDHERGRGHDRGHDRDGDDRR